MRNLQNGKHFEEFYRTHSPKIYAYALRMLKKPEDALDIVQETFLMATLVITYNGPLADHLNEVYLTAWTVPTYV